VSGSIGGHYREEVFVVFAFVFGFYVVARIVAVAVSYFRKMINPNAGKMSLFAMFRIVAVVMLLLALVPVPPPHDGYHQFLRLVVSFVAGFGCVVAYNAQRNGWVVAFGLIALLFNPVFPVEFNQTDWQLFYIATAFTMGLSIVELKVADQQRGDANAGTQAL